MMAKLSVCILTHNDEQNLELLLPSLKFADEIVVIDDESVDKTVRVARRFGAKIWKRKLDDNFAKQRNFGLKHCQGPWVLFIDPDEQLSDELSKEILKNIEAPQSNGFLIPRRDIYRGKQLRWGEGGSIKLLRLGKKGAGWWSRPVHELWLIPKPIELQANLWHRAHENKTEFIESVRRYAKIEAAYRLESNAKWSLFENLVWPVGKWVNNYFLKLGVLDGTAGFWYASIMAYHSFLVRYNLFKRTYPEKTPVLKIMRWWRWIFWIFLLLLSTYQLNRWQITPGLAVYGFELMLGILTMVGVVIAYQRKGWSWPPYLGGMLFFWLALGISLAANWAELGAATVALVSLHWWRLLYYGSFGLVFWNMVSLGVVKLESSRILMYTGFAVVGFGLIQYIFFPDLRWLYAYGWDDHLYRLAGTLLDPGFTGLIIALTMGIMVTKKYPFWKFTWVIAFSALLLTYARSAYGVYIAGEVTNALTTRSFKGSLIRVLLLLGCMFLLPRPAGEGVRLERTASIEARAKSAVTAWDIYKTKPIFGIGYNAYRIYTQPSLDLGQRPMHPSASDNSFLHILVTAGVVGMTGFLVLVVNMIWVSRKSPILLVTLVMIGVGSVSNNSLFYPFVLIWVMMLWSELAIAKNIRENK